MTKKQKMRGKVRIELTDEFLAQQGHNQESYKNLSKGGRWSVRNRAKHYAINKISLAKKPEYYAQRHRKYQLSRMYGITEEQYNQMLASQNGCCAICGTNKPTGKWKVFAVDHDHKTGKVRELLCNECNRGMGLLRDNAELLQKAANYILKHDHKTKLEKLK